MSRLPTKQSHEHEKPLSVLNINTKLDDIFHFILPNESDRKQHDLDCKITETSLFNDSVNRNPFSDDIIRCYALKPQENCFGIRVNTILSYCTINQKVNKLKNFMKTITINIERVKKKLNFLLKSTKYFFFV